jgi:hypothetical protein
MNKYSAVRDQMKTGDVIAFSGKGRTSNIIKWKTNSDISHVGIVLNTVMEEGFDQSVMLIESTSLVNLPDAETKELIKGVQIHWLSKRLETYDGQAYWVPLAKPLEDYEALNMRHWLRRKHAKKTKYDTVQALGSALDVLDGLGLENEPDFNLLFCSELVTKALKIAGRVPENINPSEMTPADVMHFECLESRVQIG